MPFWYVKLNPFSCSPPTFLYLRPIYILQCTCFSLHFSLDISRSCWAIWENGVSLLSVSTEILKTCKNENFSGLRQNPDSYKNVKGNIVYSVNTRHFECTQLSCVCFMYSGRDSSVGIATRYGLDGPWIESRCRRGFPHPSIPALGPTQSPVQWVQGLSRG